MLKWTCIIGLFLSFAMGPCMFGGVLVSAAGEDDLNPVVVLETNYGDITLELFMKDAPISVDNFLSYVQDGFYDKTVFHRVVKGFVIQAGGMIEVGLHRAANAPIVNEADNGLMNKRGTVSMARTSEINSGTSHFFINLRDNTSLDHYPNDPTKFGYAVFGRVADGMDVVDRIAQVEVTSEGTYQDLPASPVVIRRAYVQAKATAAKRGLATAYDSATPMPASPPVITVDVSFYEPSGNSALDAEEHGSAEVSLRNEGTGAAYGVRVRASLVSAVEGLAVGGDVEIGKLEPGERRSTEISLGADEDIPSREVSLKIECIEANGFDADPVVLKFNTKALVPPELVLADFGVETVSGSTELKPGEQADITVRIKNNGAGIAAGVRVGVQPGTGEDVFMPGAGEFEIGVVGAGGYRDITFTFFTNKRYEGSDVPFTVTIAEERNRYGGDFSFSVPLRKVVTPIREVAVVAEEESGGAAKSAHPRPLRIDIETDIPMGREKKPDAVAVVFGISAYKNPDVPRVDFAVRDAEVVRKYLEKSLGYDPVNILFATDEDATLGRFKTLIEGRLRNYVKPGESDVFFYYSGHGAPDPETREGYFIPYECDPNYARNGGYPVSQLYTILEGLGARSTTVVIDACFTGMTVEGKSLISRVSPIYVEEVKGLPLTLPNGAIFHAGSS